MAFQAPLVCTTRHSPRYGEWVACHAHRGGGAVAARPLSPPPRTLAEALRQVDRLDHRGIDGTVIRSGLDALDLVDRVHSVGHLAEHRVLAIEPRRGRG